MIDLKETVCLLKAQVTVFLKVISLWARLIVCKEE